MSDKNAAVTMEAVYEAAQCWCDPETQHIVMDADLAHAFSHRIEKHLANEAVLTQERDTLRARVAKLELALRVYANQKNWQQIEPDRCGYFPSAFDPPGDVIPDHMDSSKCHWQIAHEALKGFIKRSEGSE